MEVRSLNSSGRLPTIPSLLIAAATTARDLHHPLFLIFYWRGTHWVHGVRQNRTQRSKFRAVTLIGILPCLGEGDGRGFMFCTLMEAQNGLLQVWFQQRCSTASYCQHKLLAYSVCTLNDMIEITNGQLWKNSSQNSVFLRGVECHCRVAEFLLHNYKRMIKSKFRSSNTVQY